MPSSSQVGSPRDRYMFNVFISDPDDGIKRFLKFADDTKHSWGSGRFRRDASTPQEDLDGPEEWANEKPYEIQQGQV